MHDYIDAIQCASQQQCRSILKKTFDKHTVLIFKMMMQYYRLNYPTEKKIKKIAPP